MKKIITIIFITFSSLTFVSGQGYEDFRNEGTQKFDNSKYEQAIANYRVGLKCEDVPKINNLSELIKKSEICLAYKNQADSLFLQNEFVVAQYLYKKVLILNNKDTDCKNKIKICNEEIACYSNNRKQGEIAFETANYSQAANLFHTAKNCIIIPEYDDIDTLREEALICDSLKLQADKMYDKNKYYAAMEFYDEVIDYNPNDQYCIDKITDLERKHYWQLGYNSSLSNFLGLRIGYVGKFGPYVNFRYGGDIKHFNQNFSAYAVTGGYYANFFEKRNYNIYAYLGAGYGNKWAYDTKNDAEFWIGELSTRGYNLTNMQGILEDFVGYMEYNDFYREYFNGLELEAGLQIQWMRFYMNAGVVSCVNKELQKSFDLSIGVGYIFNNAKIKVKDTEENNKFNPTLTAQYSINSYYKGVGFSIAKLKNWGGYIKADFGKNWLWSSQSSLCYVDELSDIKYIDSKGNSYIETMYLDYETNIPVEDVWDLSYKISPFTYSVTMGVTKQIISMNFFKLHLLAGIGYGNWAKQNKKNPLMGERYFYTNSFFSENPHIIDINGNNIEIDNTTIEGFWVMPGTGINSNPPQKELSGVVVDAGIYTQIEHLTVQLSYSSLFGSADEHWIRPDSKGLFSLGIGWTF